MVASIPGEVDMYDYVIVGAGSAGCVLAARLSEDPDVNVLLLEAGPADTNENIHVPLGYLQLARTEVDWDYCSAPEPNCDYRRIPLPRGKVLGGSSSINAMVYIRGNPLDYDSWGVAGWSWSDLFPYFLKAEDNERGASRWHGVGGPLPVSENRSRNRIAEAFVDAGEQAGLARNEDFNGAAQDGVGIYQVTQRGGQRASAAVAYLHLALEPPALEEYEATQTGPFASNLAETGGFARVEAGAPAPDTQFHVAGVQIVDEGMTDPEGHGAWVSPCLLTPRSRGSVQLASNDPSAKPIVHNQLYSEPEDMRRMIEGLRLTLEICGQAAMKPFCAEAFTTPEGDSDEALRAHVARTTYLVYHPVGTCRMGEDADAVVDEQLRVNGLDGLRVV